MRPEFGCAIHDLVFAPVNAATAGRIRYEVHDRARPLGAAHRGARRRGHRRRRTSTACCSSTSATRSAAPTTRAAWSSPSTSSRPRNSAVQRKRRLMALPAPTSTTAASSSSSTTPSATSSSAAPSGPTTTSPTPGVTLIEAVALHGRPARLPPQPRAGEEPSGLPRPARHHASSRPPRPAPTSPSGCPPRSPRPVVLPAGTEVATGRTETEEAVVFATEDDLTVVPCELPPWCAQEAGATPEDRDAGRPRRPRRGRLRRPAPQPGDTLLFGLSAAVPHCAVVAASWTAGWTASASTRASRRCVWEAWTARRLGGRARSAEDATGGLNRPGEVVLHVPAGHTRLPRRAGRRPAGCAAGSPSRTPASRSTRASPDRALRRGVHHRRHDRAPCTPRRSATSRSASPTGVPGQRLRLAHAPVVVDDPPLRAGGRPTTRAGSDWQVVADFAASGPARPPRPPRRGHRRDRLRPVGPRTRRQPAPVRGRAAQGLRSSGPRRYRTGGGRAGNVARGAIQVLRSSIPYVARVENREARARRGRRRDGRGGEGPGPDHAARPGPGRDPARLRGARPAGRPRGRPDRLSSTRARAGRTTGRRRGTGAGRPPGRARPRRPAPLRAARARRRAAGRITRYLDERRPIGTRLAVGPPFYQGVTVRRDAALLPRRSRTDRCGPAPWTPCTSTSTR